MKKIGFIGAFDKTDLLLNVAKILTIMEQRVLVIDSTINQKAKYIVPAINPTLSYVTSFEDIDVAVGFKSVEDIKNYLGITQDLPYDILLIDIDVPSRISEFNIDMADKNYFVTSFDVYSLRRGMEILAALNVPVNITKIYFAKEVLKEDDEYFNFLALGHKAVWDNERIYFPIENGDLTVIAENQRVQKIKFKRLSTQYKDSLSFIAQQILNERNDSNVRRAIKNIERGA
ncbi:MAG: hypothetical protein HFJ59_03325 [Clostridia bacterium]|nr:hypothetical protein [Clostridia bacterium]